MGEAGQRVQEAGLVWGEGQDKKTFVDNLRSAHLLQPTLDPIANRAQDPQGQDHIFMAWVMETTAGPTQPVLAEAGGGGHAPARLDLRVPGCHDPLGRSTGWFLAEGPVLPF